MIEEVPASAGETAGARRLWVPRPAPEVGVVYLLLLCLVVAASVLSGVFRTVANADNVALQSVVLGLLTIGQSFVLLSGGIDMSVGAVVKLTVLVGAILLNGHNAAIAWVVPLLCALGAAIGLVNGLVITWLKAAPFIVTFAMFSVLDGLAYLISTQPVGMTPPAMVAFYGLSWARLPVPAAVMAVIWVAAWYVLRRTRFGWHVFAVGGRSEVAMLSGIKADRVRVAVYVLSGIFAALGGLFTLVVSGLGDPQAGHNLEFLSITAAAVGGLSLTGGKGTIAGALAGVLLLTVISDVLQVTNVNTFYEQPIQGLVIIAALALYKKRRSQ